MILLRRVEDKLQVIILKLNSIITEYAEIYLHLSEGGVVRDELVAESLDVWLHRQRAIRHDLAFMEGGVYDITLLVPSSKYISYLRTSFFS